jgi:hypothetical protein
MTRGLVTVPFAFILIAGAVECDSGGSGSRKPGASMNVTLVGHEPLFNRGMNAAPAVFGGVVYVGNRTDGSSQCGSNDPRIDPMNPTLASCPHPYAGVLIVDVKDPAHPKVVGQLGPPNEGLTGISSRELRVWPGKNLLIVMNFRCSASLHACPMATDKEFGFDIRFYDLMDPIHPKLLGAYVPTSFAGKQVKPHEMFLWIDPKKQDRALLFLSTPTSEVDPAVPNLIVADISAVPGGGMVTEIAEGNWNMFYPGAEVMKSYDSNLFVHSVSVSYDGSQTYMALEAGHFLVLDTTTVTATPDATIPIVLPLSLNDKLLTQPGDRPMWGPEPRPSGPPPSCTVACPNSHSSVKVQGRPLMVTTDEVYGKATAMNNGCPWGWMRLIDIADVAHPKITGEYKLPQNEMSFCGSPDDDPQTEQFASFSSHNPTVLPHLALVTWHSAGLQIVDTTDPAHPRQAGFFLPTPLQSVANEDPALGGGTGPNKAILWSYPIIKDGLIYVVDIRNGLYILRYTGPSANEVSDIKFLEGNSNLGDAARLGN